MVRPGHSPVFAPIWGASAASSATRSPALCGRYPDVVTLPSLASCYHQHALASWQAARSGCGLLGRHDQRQVVLGCLVVVVLRLGQPVHGLLHRVPQRFATSDLAMASRTCGARSASGIWTVVPDSRSVSSAVPAARPRLPIVTRNGMPTSSASLNFTPARTGRSSTMTSTPALARAS